MDDYFGAVLNSKKSSWTSTKLPSRRRRKLCELIDYTGSLVYLGVDVLKRGIPWWVCDLGRSEFFHPRSVVSLLLMR